MQKNIKKVVSKKKKIEIPSKPNEKLKFKKEEPIVKDTIS